MLLSSATAPAKEYPILMQPSMAKATRIGVKTQTRRFTGLHYINATIEQWECRGTIITPVSASYYRLQRIKKPSIPNKKSILVTEDDNYSIVISASTTKCDANTLYVMFKHTESGKTVYIKSPYGKTKDVLWVRETRYILEDGEEYWASDMIGAEFEQGVQYKTVPSIHLKRIHAKLFLKVESVSIERLWDISADDAIAEGIEGYFHDVYKRKVWKDYMPTKTKDEPELVCSTPITSFKTLICSIHGNELEDSNPYVWVVKFNLNALKNIQQ